MLAFERLAEEKIREAIAAGELEQLPGKGKPLSLDDYFSVRPEERVAYWVLKNSGFLPEHLQLRKELEKHLHELECCWEQCRERLGKLLARCRATTEISGNSPRKKSPGFALRQVLWFRKSWEQNPALRRGKRVVPAVAEQDWQTRQAKHVHRAYLDERLWLRRRMGELAHRAGETAQRLHDALVEKEIRDRRPLVFLLGSPFILAEDILAQFDREFPVFENDHASQPQLARAAAS